MASIVKRKKKYSVVYSYTDEKGKQHQQWETFANNVTQRSAKRRSNANRKTEHL